MTLSYIYDVLKLVHFKKTKFLLWARKKVRPSFLCKILRRFRWW